MIAVPFNQDHLLTPILCLFLIGPGSLLAALFAEECSLVGGVTIGVVEVLVEAHAVGAGDTNN